MPKSSRHKSRSRKHGELDDDGSSRDRKVKAEDSAARVSKSSAGSKEMSNGERKRKERAGESVVVVDDRWNGGAEDEHVGDKKAKSEFVEVVEMDKSVLGKLKVSVGETKSRRGERDVEVGGVRVEVVKLKGEKESSRKESSSSHKSFKEREHVKDLKERETKDRDRDYGKEVKEKERDNGKDVKVKERDHGKDSKERDRDHGKDLKEKERDHIKDLKERDRDSSRDLKEKEKDRDYNRDVKDRDYSKDAKEKDRDYSKDAKEKEREHPKDVKERDRDHPKDVKEKDREIGKEAKERDREHPKDVKQRDRDHPKDVKEHSRDVKERLRDNSKDPKERERDHTNDGKERDRDHTRDLKERDRDHTRDAKEKDRDHLKDTKERDAKERDRDHQKEVKERERDYYKEDRNRDYYKDVKDRDRESYKDVKERDRDYPKDGREREREYIRETKERDYSKDGRERERDYHRDARDRDRDYKDGRERDRERGTERDKRVQDARNERSDDVVSRKQASKIIPTGEDHGSKKNIEISGGQTQDGVRNHEPEKETEKNIRRRDSSGDKVKYLGDLRDIDDRRLPSRDDHTKNSSHKDESQREGRYRDRYREDLDRDLRDRDDRGRDERSTRDHTNSKSGNKHYRDDTRVQEVYYKKSKIQDTDHDTTGPYIDDHGTKLKDNRGRKVFTDETDDAIDLKLRGAKDPHEEVDNNGSSTSKFDPRSDRGRMDYMHTDKVDSNLGRPKGSPGSGNHSMMDQFRASSKQVGSSGRKSSEEKLRANTASRGDNIVVAGVHERDSESWLLEKRRPKEGVRSSDVDYAAPHYDRTPKSDARPSQSSLTQKSPSTGSDRRFSDKNGPRRNFDFEGHKSNSSRYVRDFSNSKDRERGLPFERSMSNDLFRGEKFDSESIPTGVPFNRTSNLSGSSPSNLPPPPQGGHGTGIPSLLGTYEDENRSQIGDRKPNSRFRRNVDHGMGRGQVNAYKGPSTWQSPVPNGFIPLQHGPPHPGFHPSVQQFASPLYGGVRPSIELSHTVSPYHMHEVSDRFPAHGRPFGWHNPMDDCPPFPGWDVRNGAFSDDPHTYGRAEWDIGRQMIGTRGWPPNGNINLELPLPAESEYPACNEAWTGQTGLQPRKDRDPSECLPTVNSEVKNSNDKLPVKNSIENPQKSLHEKTSDPFKPTGQETTTAANGYSKIHLCCNYLSKLDISLDLAQPDLYQDCMSHLGTKDKAGVYDHVSKEKSSQNGKGDRIVAAGSRYDILSAVFPTRTDAIFQRAMTLYKKHSGRKENYSASLSSCAEEKRGSSEVLESETPIAVDKQRTSAESPAVEEVTVADIQASLDTPMPNADCTSVFGEEKSTPIDSEGSGPSEALEQQSGSISDAVHFDDDSQSCDALMAECRVNVSRIHLSPGSTH